MLEHQFIIVCDSNHRISARAERSFPIGLPGGEVDQDLSIIGNPCVFFIRIDGVHEVQRIAGDKVIRRNLAEGSGIVPVLAVEAILTVIRGPVEDGHAVVGIPEEAELVIDIDTRGSILKGSVENVRILNRRSGLVQLGYGTGGEQKGRKTNHEKTGFHSRHDSVLSIPKIGRNP